MIKTILLWTLIATLLLTLAFMVAISIPFYKVINAPKIDTEHIEQEKFFLAFYKTIGIGFLIAFLGLIIPHVVAESKESFLRFKNSRQAYSKAKTAIIYLPLKLSNMKNSEAIAAIEEAHHKLHICETYRKELRKHLSCHLHKKTWVDRNYWELVAIRKVLDENIATWDKKEQCDRLKILVDAVDMV